MGVLLVQYGGDPVTLVTLCHYASGHKKNYVKEHTKKKNMWPNLSNNKNPIIKLNEK